MGELTYFFQKSSGTGIDLLDGKFTADSPNAIGPEEECRPLRTFAGLFWFVALEEKRRGQSAKHRSGLHVLSTEEIAIAMDGGHKPRAISGPFSTREAAERSFERYWEMILGDN